MLRLVDARRVGNNCTQNGTEVEHFKGVVCVHGGQLICCGWVRICVQVLNEKKKLRRRVETVVWSRLRQVVNAVFAVRWLAAQ